MQRPIPGFLGSELLEQIQCGESGLLPECGGDQRFAGVPGIIELFGADEVIRSLNFPIGPRHTHVETLRFFTPDVAVAAHDAEVDLTDGERPARSDSQPAFHQFWFCIGSPNKAARSVEGARNQDGGVALGRHGQHVHLSVCRSASRFAKFPKLPVTFQILAGMDQGLRRETTRTSLAGMTLSDQARPFEDLEVLRDGRLAHPERLGQFVDRCFTQGETRENGATGRISEGSEGGVEAGGVHNQTDR